MTIEELEQIISKWKEKREETIQVLVSLFERLDKHIEENSIDWIDRDKRRILEEARYIALLTQDIADWETGYFSLED